MPTKVKITRQQIKQDKFTTFMLKAKDWFLDNWQAVSIGAAVVVVAAAAFVYFSKTKSANAIEGANRLTAATLELRRQNYQPAILEFGAIADEYGGRIAAQAVFYLATAHYESRNYDEAIAAFQRYIDKYPYDKITTASAIAGIAACLENKLEYQSAGDKYREALKYYPQSPSAPEYYLGAVRCYVMAADKQKAEETLQELEEKFPGSDQARTATMLAMRLKVH
jgi:TolA-binding protein